MPDADLHFYFDPVCQFAWMTSKWVRNVIAVRDYIDALDAQGLLLLGIAEARIFDAAIPFCPGWALSELIIHLGYIYRWVTVIVGHARLDPPGRQKRTELDDPDPADYTSTLRRLRSAHTALVRVPFTTPTRRGDMTDVRLSGDSHDPTSRHPVPEFVQCGQGERIITGRRSALPTSTSRRAESTYTALQRV